MPVTPQAAGVPVPNSQREQVIVQAKLESFAPQSHFLISPDTAHQFSVLAAQLEVSTQKKSFMPVGRGCPSRWQIGAVIGAASGTGVQAVTKRAPADLPAESC